MSQDERFQTEALEQLKELLRIPSISALPEHKGDIQKAADFVEAALKRAGMTETRQVTRGGGNPMVFGAWTGAPGKPTLLLYGHYDVQPPDPLDEWKSPPFEPEIRGNDLFARGACDDKGQVFIQIKAAVFSVVFAFTLSLVLCIVTQLVTLGNFKTDARGLPIA